MFSAPTPTLPPPRTQSRLGCLGCLWQVPLILLLGCVLVLAMTWVFYPWAFYLGGSFHIIPYWTGWGKLHAKSGDYLLYVRFEPWTRPHRMYPGNDLRGIAYLCTPRGERFRMSLGGGMRANLNRSTDGEAINLYMYYWPALYGQFINDHRPSIRLRGHWQNPNLVMDDNGSISQAFQPDGRVYRGQGGRGSSSEIVPITLVQGSYSDFHTSCANVHR